MKTLQILTLTVALGVVATPALAATIATGDVTTSLEGDLFFDDARTGGGDATVNEPGQQVVNRFLDFDGNGTISAPGTPGVVTIQGFGFATSAAAAANDASQLDVTFIYLGANENFGGADDVLIGTERVDYNHTGGGEYFVNFDTDPSGLIDGLGSRFRIEVKPVDIDGGLVESIRFKTRPPGEQSFGHQGPTMSLSGSFVATTPEPTSLAMLALAGIAAVGSRRS